MIWRPTRSTPGKSLSELMSIEERVEKLTDFLLSVSDWAYVNFVSQCFIEPDAIRSAKPNDPQVTMFKKSIAKSDKDKYSSLLDFGAGKGRLYGQFKNDTEFMSKIDYSALEPEKSYHTFLLDLGISNIYSRYDEIPENKFNYVVLCNVLHEIPIINWVKTLNKIIRSIKGNGFLIIIEDRILSKGEKIDNAGFLVLDANELKELFRLAEIPSLITLENNDRIMCSIIPKKDLRKISKINVNKAIRALEKNTLDKIFKIKNTTIIEAHKTSYGRKLAFFQQLYFNSKFALRVLNN